MKRVVQIADMIVSDDPSDVLITYALGPCLGVSVWDAESCVGGLIHCQLPSAKEDTERAKKCPWQFVDTGMLDMLERLFALGAAPHRLVIKAAGAARVVENLNVFKIAERNHTAFRRLLWKNDLPIAAEEVGGDQPRTMSLQIGTGQTLLQSAGRTWELKSNVPSRFAPANQAVGVA